ncbi:MAG TPA: ABC transporter substrate binding protein [Pseudolabrys sp.]|nr:ABC transporter substrate binding protein [Pseudolabrys sp.]
MRRREFISLLAGAAAAPAILHPHSAHAQQDGRVRRIGVLSSTNEEDLTSQAVLAAFRQRLVQLGWDEGRNLRLEMRFSEANIDRQNANVDDLVNLAPDVIVVGGASATRALQQRTKTIPIVFVSVGDPVASRVVSSIARPEGNTTGITNLFPSIGKRGKTRGGCRRSRPGRRPIAAPSGPMNAIAVRLRRIGA